MSAPPAVRAATLAQQAHATAMTPDTAALQRLFEQAHEQPWAHDFFALLRRVEGLSPHQPRLGRALRPAQEALRLGQEPALDFAPAPVSSLTLRDGGPPRLGVRFFGLLGSQGPLPLHLTEYTRERLQHRGDPTLARFLDLFHHRLLLLFYRAWADSQPAVQQDRPGDDRFAAWLGAASGLDGTLRPHDRVPQAARLHQAALLGEQARHPEALAKVLALQFGVPVRVQPQVGHWLRIAPEDRSRLGHARRRPESARVQPARLGRDAVAGHQVWDRQYRLRVVLGPLDLPRWRSFLPDGHAWAPLHDWIRQIVGPGLQWDVQPLLAREALPAPRLDQRPRLGLTSWAGRSAAADCAPLRLPPHKRLRTAP